MSVRLPPLNSLRAFEVAARRGGFTGAAEELHVTPAAISHQVKTLESHLGLQLFKRLPRGLVLTDAGRELLPQLSRGFDHFARGLGRLKAGGLSGPVTVNAAPSIAALWLVPRLDAFLQSYPEIQVRVLASDDAPDLDRGEADLRIVYGMGEYPGFRTRLMMRDAIFPVCAPSLLNTRPLRRFSDLRQHTLLQDIDIDPAEPTMTWKRWLHDAGVESVLSGRWVEFGNSILLTEAAVRGLGVALGRMSLVWNHLKSGRLVRPLKAERPSDYSYYTVTTPALAERRRVRVFIEWLEAEVERDQRAAETDRLG